jgi:tRNA-splicing ligase RtcB (3'-phosphate/5'-hydroxy nucleic acid ligase)
MRKLKIDAKAIRQLGYPNTPVIPVIMDVVQKHFKYADREYVMDTLKQILENPEAFIKHEHWQKVAVFFTALPEPETKFHKLKPIGVPITIVGAQYIDKQAVHQIHVASKLPIAVAAALMPDAHSGYELPIGGVLATHNALIPYGVGVDIGCRMALSIFPMPAAELKTRDKIYTTILDEHTLFGSGKEFERAFDHEILEDSRFYELPLLKNLHRKAYRQLGSSGSGNHFVEFGVVKITDMNNKMKLPLGEYVGLLSHSGSRALGANIAQHFTTIAKNKCGLPAEAANLAWLHLNDEDGVAYWLAMNLAGDYAKACHDVIHQRIAKALKTKPIAIIQNHHNFAWQEQWNGLDVIVHRKGATPASTNEMGIIPSSMTGNGYIVSGTGNSDAINSASHGAGRLMSRGRAAQSITIKAMKEDLKKHSVTLIGAGIDEAPQAYKNIEHVMQAQNELVNIEGVFVPKIVKMDR